MDARMQRGISLSNVFLVRMMGAKKAVQPTIISVLNILLPTTLPIEISALPFRADEIDTANSGADVPKATTVKPITKSDTLSFLASDDAPSVR